MTLDCTDIKLERGSRGAQVIELQNSLQKIGYYLKAPDDGAALKVDGKYEKYTVLAVKAFQKDSGTLAQDGWVGPYTCKKINEKLATIKDTKKTEKKASNNTQAKNSTGTQIIIDAKKYNIIPASQANITVEGIHFRAETVAEKDTFGRETQWKPVNMMDNQIYFTEEHSIEPSIEVTFDLHFDQYKKMMNGLKLIQNKHQCKVLTELFDSGHYFIEFTKTYDKVDLFKVTMKLMKSVKQLEGA